MTNILHVALGNDTSSASGLAAVPLIVTRLEVASEDSSISTLRDLVAAAPGPVGVFILSVGDIAAPKNADDARWEQQVLKPLRQSFALLTGAGRRFRQEGPGTILVLMPSAAIGVAEVATPQLVLLRSITGMAEALRAELQASGIRVGIVFYDGDEKGSGALASRLASAINAGPLYSLSADITAERIDAYFAPLFSTLDQTSAGPPLPDIGPMAAVYDLVAAGAPPT